MARADPIGAGSAFVMVRAARPTGGRGSRGRTGRGATRKLRAYVAASARGRRRAHRRLPRRADGRPFVETSEPSAARRRATTQNHGRVAAALVRRMARRRVRAGPCLVVLEDLHWGDLPSVTLPRRSAAALAAKPLMVLALARPEVHEPFRDLWAGAEQRLGSAGSPRAPPSDSCGPRSMTPSPPDRFAHRPARRRQRLLPGRADAPSGRGRRGPAARDRARSRGVSPRAA